MTGWWSVHIAEFFLCNFTGCIAYHIVCMFSAREWRWKLPFWGHKSFAGGAPC